MPHAKQTIFISLAAPEDNELRIDTYSARTIDNINNEKVVSYLADLMILNKPMNFFFGYS